MPLENLLIDPRELWPMNDPSSALRFVDLEACPDDLSLDRLPPFPVIGLGDPAHPFARALDAVIESPISAEALIRQITRAPCAAALTVQLLRCLDGLPIDRALQMESISYGLLQGSAEHVAWLAEHGLPSNVRHAPPGQVAVDRSDSVLQIILDRPAARNAIDREMRDQLFDAFMVAAVDPDIRSIKLRAIGPTFSMGGDVDEFGTTRDPATAHLIRSRTLPALALFERAHLLDVHIQGACVGAGLELAAFARRVTAGPDAWFQLPELPMGLIPGAGGCVSVPRRIGRQRAALMILSGRRINATTALRWGLIDAVDASPTA